MGLFTHRNSHRAPGADPMWDLASATPIFTADDAEVTQRARQLAGRDCEPRADGLLVARRHPTGWFVHAVRRDSLEADQVAFFADLVTVRTHALLTCGPEAPVWSRPTDDATWLSAAFVATAADLAA